MDLEPMKDIQQDNVSLHEEIVETMDHTKTYV